ncbi:hypothetical protein BsWGS_11300 [Bradybaena similaris]
MVDPGKPRMTLTCLLAGVTVFLMTLHVSCTHTPTLSPQTKDQSTLEASSNYALVHILPVSLVRGRRSTGPYGAPGNPQDSPHAILVVGDKRTDWGPSIFVRGQSDNEEAPRPWSRRHSDNEEAPQPWSMRQAHTDNEDDVVIKRLAPNNQMAPSVWNEGPRGRQRSLLQPVVAPGVITPSMATLMMLQKKKTKNRQEIGDAMYKRYGSAVDMSEGSLFKKQQMLAKLLHLKNILKRQHRETAEDRSLNDIEGAWPDDHKYSWSDEPLHRHVPGHTDPALGQQLIANVNDHKPRDGRYGDEMYLPNLETLAYSNDGKWSSPSDTSVDVPASISKHASDELDQAHISLDQLDSGRNDRHLTSSDLQYSTLTDVFHRGPGVTGEDNHRGGAFSGVSGRFLDDQKDCHGISTKACLSDLDCACAGFYTCDEGRCQLLNNLKSSANKHNWGKGPAEKHNWENGPENKHSWFSGSAAKHGWMNGPANNHGWATGPANIHGRANGLVEFARVEEPATSQITDNVLWHNEPFDFSKMETADVPRQPTDSAIWPEPRDPDLTDPPGDPDLTDPPGDPGLTDPPGDAQVRANVQKSAGQPVWDRSPADWNLWLQGTDTRLPWNPEHNFLVEEPELANE